MKIYIAGPIAGAPLHERKQQFDLASQQLIAAGFYPIDPMCVPPQCGGRCSGTKERPDDAHARTCYLKYDLIEMLYRAEGIALLPGWELSQGAQVERGIAVHCGIEARLLEEWL